MFGKFIRPVVPTVPKSEHEALQRQHSTRGEQVAQLLKEVAMLKEVNADQLKHIEELDDTRAMQHMLLQKAVNLILEKANTSKARKERVAEVVDGARMLGIDVFAVVVQAETKEVKE